MPAEAGIQKFPGICDRQPAVQPFRLDGVFEHFGALRAGNDQDFRSGFQGLPDPDSAGTVPFPAQNIREEISSPATAAEGVCPILAHFHQFDTGNGPENVAWGFVLTSMPAEVTGVMKRHPGSKVPRFRFPDSNTD
jgi:hypothetical protein